MQTHKAMSFPVVCAVHSGGMPLLERVMGSLMLCLQRDAEMRSDEFNGRPYYRLILGFIQEMCHSQAADSHSFGLLSAIATALLSVQPLQTPSFAFPWLELISHRWSLCYCTVKLRGASADLQIL